jgi:hypothetical protein
MFSDLSAGVSYADYFDQAARTVACMAEVLKRAKRAAPEMSKLGFHVLAPLQKVSEGSFQKLVNSDSIGPKVEQRVREWVEEHKDDKAEWLSEWFEPVLERIKLDVLAWEDVVATITQHDAQAGETIKVFYDRCLECN